MKEHIATDSTVSATVHSQSKKAYSADNSLSSTSGLGCDTSGNVTAASSPATIPLRLQQTFNNPSQEVIVQVQGSSSSPSCYQSPGSSQGASRASTLSLSHSLHKKKVNIIPSGGDKLGQLKNDVDIESDVDIEAALETTALNHGAQFPSGNESRTTTPGENYLTMSGTITRGKRAGQHADVKLNISREELELIESTHTKLKAQLECTSATLAPTNGENGTPSSKHGCCCCPCCSCGRGPHIFLWSIVTFPFVFLFASIYSFYMGTLTWYNVFSLYTEEEKPFLCRILMAPILILSYPVFILLSTPGLGLYTACSSITCQWFRWRSCVQDLEKGFYAWLCSILKVEECSPYTEVVIVGQLDGLLTHSSSAPAGVGIGGPNNGPPAHHPAHQHHRHHQGE